MGFKIFGENLAAVQLQKKRVVIDKPTQVGFKVLEASKLLMLDFFYDKLKMWYGDKVHLLFTDTESLMLEIETKDVYEDFKARSEFFDFSGYPKDHPCYDKTNNKVIGKFKDETNGDPILEFAFLRPKMYSFTLMKDNEVIVDKHRAKGVTRAASRTLQHEDFVAQVQAPHENHLINRRIASNMHQIHSIEVNKRALCAFDDKRFIEEDGE